MDSEMLFPALWFLARLSGIVLASYLAFLLGRRLGTREASRADREQDAAVGSHVAATLGLLAFTLAIVFNMAHEKHSGRKALVRRDALAVQTAYQRAVLLPGDEAKLARERIAEYAKIRAIGGRSRSKLDLEGIIARSEQIQEELWLQAGKNKDSKDTWFYMEALNKMAEAHAERITMGIHDRIPVAVWYLLALVAMLAFWIAPRHRHHPLGVRLFSSALRGDRPRPPEQRHSTGGPKPHAPGARGPAEKTLSAKSTRPWTSREHSLHG
jgi:hypothetical protein